MKAFPPRIYTLSVPFPRYPSPFPGIEEGEGEGEEGQGETAQRRQAETEIRTNLVNVQIRSTDILFLPSPAGPPFDLPLSNTQLTTAVVVVVVLVLLSPPAQSVYSTQFLSTCFAVFFLPLFFGKRKSIQKIYN